MWYRQEREGPGREVGVGGGVRHLEVPAALELRRDQVRALRTHLEHERDPLAQLRL